jgi:hypothetical protein
MRFPNRKMEKHHIFCDKDLKPTKRKILKCLVIMEFSKKIIYPYFSAIKNYLLVESLNRDYN